MVRRLVGTIRKRGFALGMILPLVLGAVQPVLAWDGERKLSESAYKGAIVATDSRSAVAVWTEPGPGLVIRRTADDGATWSPALRLSAVESGTPVLSAVGSHVDLLTDRYDTVCGGEPGTALIYRRSINGGITWSPPRRVACVQERGPQSRLAFHHDVTRGVDGQVTVAWTVMNSPERTAEHFGRTSTDGGSTFAPRRLIGRSYHVNLGDSIHAAWAGSWGARVAIGSDATYATFLTASRNAPQDVRLVTRRSADKGVMWSAPIQLGRASPSDFDLLASGSRIAASFTFSDDAGTRARYRISRDSGGSWGPVRVIAPVDQTVHSRSLRFAYRAGLLVAIFQRYRLTGGNLDGHVAHRESRDFGATWSQRTRVSVEHPASESGYGAAVTERQLVLYSVESSLYVRRGPP